MPRQTPSLSPLRSCHCARVAVYGTLRAGGSNDIRRLRPNIVCVGTTWLTGTLYDLGEYPALSLVGTQPVLAEVYALDAALEEQLDRIEELWPAPTGEYAKRMISVTIAPPDGGSFIADVLVYEGQPTFVRGKPKIAASDWLAWHRDRD